MTNIESVLLEKRVFPPGERSVRAAAISGMDAYLALCKRAQSDPDGFGRGLALENVLWHKPFTQVLDESKAPFYRWFADGQLNASYNCLDRNLQNGNADKTAIIFEADGGEVTRITYR